MMFQEDWKLVVLKPDLECPVCGQAQDIDFGGASLLPNFEQDCDGCNHLIHYDDAGKGDDGRQFMAATWTKPFVASQAKQQVDSTEEHLCPVCDGEFNTDDDGAKFCRSCSNAIGSP
jgi:hypothetical protein